jgi:predicted DCC family thiol-disulfide oxidoreductase YuxK
MKDDFEDRGALSLPLQSLREQDGEVELQHTTPDPDPHPIVLYDGVCGLCNRFVQFILRRDRRAIFRFAALQSLFAARILARHGANAADLDTVYVVIDYDLPSESLLSRCDAVIFALEDLGRFWGLAAHVLKIIPRRVRDWGYQVVARSRYRIFGRYDTCPLPTEDTRARFLDL